MPQYVAAAEEPEAVPEVVAAHEHVPAPALSPVAEPDAPGDEHQIPWLREDQVQFVTEDDDLEDGWRAVMPSGQFFSIAIAGAGAGLVIAGLAMRFQSLLTTAHHP